MSWGEKSCKLYGKCSEATEETCNKNCEIYSTGLESDTELEEIAETAQKETPEIVLIHSTAPKFDKKYEFVVLKKHIFYMQDISPKKIILKFKKKLKPTDSLQDGIYCFVNKDKEPLEFKKVFKQFDDQAKQKEKEKK